MVMVWMWVCFVYLENCIINRFYIDLIFIILIKESINSSCRLKIEIKPLKIKNNFSKYRYFLKMWIFSSYTLTFLLRLHKRYLRSNAITNIVGYWLSEKYDCKFYRINYILMSRIIAQIHTLHNLIDFKNSW